MGGAPVSEMIANIVFNVIDAKYYCSWFLAEQLYKRVLTCIYYVLSVYPRLRKQWQNWYMSLRMTKPTKWHMHPVKTQISLGIRPVWLESLLSAWRKLGSLATHWVHSEDSDHTGHSPSLIWVFARHTLFCWFCHEVAHLTLLSVSLVMCCLVGWLGTAFCSDFWKRKGITIFIIINTPGVQQCTSPKNDVPETKCGPLYKMS